MLSKNNEIVLKLKWSGRRLNSSPLNTPLEIIYGPLSIKISLNSRAQSLLLVDDALCFGCRGIFLLRHRHSPNAAVGCCSFASSNTYLFLLKGLPPTWRAGASGWTAAALLMNTHCCNRYYHHQFCVYVIRLCATHRPLSPDEWVFDKRRDLGRQQALPLIHWIIQIP